MDYQKYQQLFNEILGAKHPGYPYNNEIYLSYVKLNKARMMRWNKVLKLEDKLLGKLKQINCPQHWIIITEPWCGDAAHIIPFLMSMAAQNCLISYDIILRDSEPFLIESYLTRERKSIPKLIVRNENGVDLFNWGPRPEPAQNLINQLKAVNTDTEVTKAALQHWYNEDKGQSLGNELTRLFE
jgi:hypothetical protein